MIFAPFGMAVRAASSFQSSIIVLLCLSGCGSGTRTSGSTADSGPEDADSEECTAFTGVLPAGIWTAATKDLTIEADGRGVVDASCRGLGAIATTYVDANVVNWNVHWTPPDPPPDGAYDGDAPATGELCNHRLELSFDGRNIEVFRDDSDIPAERCD